MISSLAAIIQQKKREVALLRQKLMQGINVEIAKVLAGELPSRLVPSFNSVLKSTMLTVIAEIKRKSPSKGMIAPIIDPVYLAKRYIKGGAQALSILTDHKFFGGQINDLSKVATALQRVPIIRKDFIIDRVQIAEAAVAGASAVLLIVAVLGHQTKELLRYAQSINLDALVEIHDHDELNIALDCGADIIGVNNRCLHSFAVDSKRAMQLVTAIPSPIIKIAESGISNPALARQYYHAGFDAVLIGEVLVKSTNPVQFITECL